MQLVMEVLELLNVGGGMTGSKAGQPAELRVPRRSLTVAAL